MKTVSLFQVLAYYDGPQVIEARDVIGGHYVGLAVDDADYEFLLVGASPERLNQFRGGAIDFLALILDRPAEIGWQLAKFAASDGGALLTSDPSWDPINPEFLPESGFFLLDSPVVPDLVK